ncbi:DUF1543 domain-containing protein [Pseudoalteromonas tunicata]|uniref:DUF1543 domain-containing protein n=1 Tax=Pseudoalteromonas tunicata TaxID=314281 RepID=UPI00273EF63F|nr:DUF1543 domain-containing protein [Pseudoalteromonas tunicata]MDP4984013.1 DUF1543 domain-containing protein [Pseudoalteromonas tunicata]
MNLYLAYLGGRIFGGNIEIHDVQFVTGESIEQTYTTLKQRWIGDKNSVHLDSYIQLTDIDGYKISLRETEQHSELKLFFVNLGGYRKDSLAEQHEFGLFVAKSSYEAKEKAMQKLLSNAQLQHKDDLYDVDDCFRVSLLDLNYHIHLEPSGKNQVLHPDWFGYQVL